MTSITLATPPAYDGVVPYPANALAYEGSPMVTEAMKGDRFQYVKELQQAHDKTKDALTLLRQVADEPVMPTRSESSWRLVSAIDDARRAISPYMNHVPGSEGFENNEVPRYLVDGSVHPDDIGNPKMNFAGSVQMHQETVIHRLPKENLEGVNWQSVKESLRTSTQIDDLLIWGNRVTESGLPDVPRAIGELETLDAQFLALLENQGARPVEQSGLLRRVGALPTGVKVAAVGALALGVIGTGIAVATKD
ncbi:MAG: hypothetical protein KDC46_01775 [Thermoleophilia bacterium]|nr:hypothetical protein [Thermoleophilia bacterium]